MLDRVVKLVAAKADKTEKDPEDYFGSRGCVYFWLSEDVGMLGRQYDDQMFEMIKTAVGLPAKGTQLVVDIIDKGMHVLFYSDEKRLTDIVNELCGSNEALVDWLLKSDATIGLKYDNYNVELRDDNDEFGSYGMSFHWQDPESEDHEYESPDVPSDFVAPNDEYKADDGCMYPSVWRDSGGSGLMMWCTNDKADIVKVALAMLEKGATITEVLST